MLQKRKTFLMASSVGLVFVLVLTLALTIFSKAFASIEYIKYIAPMDQLIQSDAEQSVEVLLLSDGNMSISGLDAMFSYHENTANEEKYFTLQSIEYSDKFDAADVTESTVYDDEGSERGVLRWGYDAVDEVTAEFTENEVIAVAYYTAKPGLVVGETYHLDIPTYSLRLADSSDDILGSLSSEIHIVEKKSQSIAYETQEVQKTYGDQSFVNPLTEHEVDGEITFASSNTDVATVDEFGEVTIVGAGNATITATAAETDSYFSTSASYTLNVAKQELNVVSASVPDKIYDGTTDSEVGVVTLSDGSLTQGVDYVATAQFDDAEVGTDKIVTVTVALTGDIAQNYDFTENTIDVENVTISPYTISASNVSLEYYVVKADGLAKEPGVFVGIGGFLVDDIEYTVEYVNNVDPGTASVIVTADEDMNIVGSAEVNFEITPKDILEISGISDQSVTYTGAPVMLGGTLTVTENEGGITADDLTTTWYAEDGETVIEQPVNVGAYVVEYSYNDADYVGSLKVNFEITKAESPEPSEVSAELEAEVGTTLAQIAGIRTAGFSWDDEGSIITAGANTYPATYTYNGDTTNYTTRSFAVSVYGLTRANINIVTDAVGGTVTAPESALENENVAIQIVPDAGYEIEEVTLNEFDVTSAVQDNELKITIGTSDINLVVSFRRVYNVIEGNGASYVIGERTSARFAFDADFSLFSAGGQVYVDGLLVDPEWYTAESGSTIITLSYEYLRAMTEGDHTIMLAFADGGVARAGFTLTSADDSNSSSASTPNTGAFTAKNGGAKVAGGLVAVVATIGVVGFVFKKKFAKSKVDFNK